MFRSLVFILFVQMCLQSEKFTTTIKKKEAFSFTEHTLKSSSLHIKIKGLNLNEGDTFKIIPYKYIIHLHNHQAFKDKLDQWAKESTSEAIFQGSSNNAEFDIWVRQAVDHDELKIVKIEIENESKSDIKFEITIKEYLGEEAGTVQQKKNTNIQDTIHEKVLLEGKNTSHTIDGKLKVKSVDYIAHLILQMKKITRLIKKVKEDEISLDEAEFGHLHNVSGNIMFFGFLSILGVVFLSLMMMYSLRSYLKRKKIM